MDKVKETQNALIAFNKEFEVVVVGCGKIEEAIDRLEQRVKDCEAPLVAELEELSSRWQDLAAEVEIGAAKDSELIALNAELAEVKASHEKIQKKYTQVSEEVEPVLAGLKRKLAKEQEVLSPMKNKKRVVEKACFEAMLEQMGEEYVAKASDLVDLFSRLYAVAGIYGDIFHGGPEAIRFGDDCKHLSIPLFRLEAHQKHQHPGQIYLFDKAEGLKHGEGSRVLKDAMRKAEYSRLEGLGLIN